MFLLKKVRQAGFRRLLMFLSGLVALAISAGIYESYWRNFFQGPERISIAELLSLKNVERRPRYWVQMDRLELIDTKIESMLRSPFLRLSTGHYWLTVQQGQIFVVITESANLSAAPRMEVALLRLPDNVRGLVAGRLPRPLQDTVSPILLDARDFRENGYYLLLALPLVIVGLLFLGLTGMVLALWPAASTSIRRLRVAGLSVDAVSSEIEQEITSGSAVALSNDAFITRRYVVRYGFWFAVEPLRQLLYVSVQNHSYPIPFSAVKHICSLQLLFHSNSISIAGKSVKSSSGAVVLARAPWALDPSLDVPMFDRLWRRKDLIVRVEDRYRDVVAKRSDAESLGPWR